MVILDQVTLLSSIVIVTPRSITSVEAGANRVLGRQLRALLRQPSTYPHPPLHLHRSRRPVDLVLPTPRLHGDFLVDPNGSSYPA